jgi:trans-2,3-dihydro-3-hydroxyanthranilate isomerase
MTTSIPFYFVDVFAERPLTGNPLTLVPDADELDIGQMQAIAREFNQSETTFLLQPTDPAATWRLRSFTPAGVEVGGAGHNALGAWLWLAHAGRLGSDPARAWTQQIGAEILPVEVLQPRGEPVQVVMEQSVPEFGTAIEVGDDLAAALGLQVDELSPDPRPQVVSTGAAHLLVPVVDGSAVDRLNVDPRALLAILRPAGGEGCYVYATRGTPQGVHAVARFFNPTVGIIEDPATGTAAGPLAALLTRAGQVPPGQPVIIEQGRAMGRPSRLRIDVSGERVRLSGAGLVVAEGTLTM